jgi:hypothetical protein
MTFYITKTAIMKSQLEAECTLRRRRCKQSRAAQNRFLYQIGLNAPVRVETQCILGQKVPCSNFGHAVFETQFTARVSHVFLKMEEQIIKAVQAKTVLYDTSHVHYMKCKLKQDIWNGIAKDLNLKDGKYFQIIYSLTNNI